MKIKVKYTITEVMYDDTENWEGDPNPEQCLELIKKEVEEDPSYVLDGLNNFTIQCELMKE